ncbi:MAG: IS1182 family transposase [Bacteroidales bacterium]|nr:IS1182 family transposase [Bacteroidales bacterium]
MKFIQGQSRKQITLFPLSLESSIDENNEVRLIDLFVDSLKMTDMGFAMEFIENGRPAYHPKDLLKLYIYGYLNRTRSSRELEKYTNRNIEVIWLLKGLSPDHNTISNFRRDNPKAIKKVFRATVEIAKFFELIGGKLIAGDGTKLRAQNSKKNNFNQKKIDRHLAYIDNKLKQYDDQLAEADKDKQEQIKAEIEKHNNRKEGYEQLQQRLDETGETQISTTDPDSRQLIIRGTITEVGYNAQSTVDAKHNLPIDYEVTNKNDKNAMTDMVENAIEIVENNTFDAVFDKGYYNAKQIDNCHELGVETHVAIPAPASNAPDKAFNVSEFIYDKANDTYTCPAGQILRTNGNWYKKKSYRVKQYKTNHCKGCELREKCTTSKSKRLIERHEYAEALERNKRAQEERPEIYKQRQAIVEHPFGTIKRQWGFDHIMTKITIERASADVGLIFTAYSLRRIFNILGFSLLQDYLKNLVLFINAIIYAIKHKKLKFTPRYISANFLYQKKIVA